MKDKITDLASPKDLNPLIYLLRLRDDKAGKSFGRVIKVKDKETLFNHLKTLEDFDLLDIKQL
jgi:hypothetical protein